MIGVELIPLGDDPIEGLRDAVGDAFDDESIEEIKREAHAAARDDTVADVTDDRIAIEEAELE